VAARPRQPGALPDTAVHAVVCLYLVVLRAGVGVTDEIATAAADTIQELQQLEVCPNDVKGLEIGIQCLKSPGPAE
jgi:hypothetical protein